MNEIVIGSNLELIDISNELKQTFIKILTFKNPQYEEAIKYGRYIGGLRPTINLYTITPNGIVIPRGLIEFIENKLINKGYKFKITDKRMFGNPINVTSNIILKPSQKKAKSDILKYPNGMLIAPAGSGKTVIGIDMIASLKQKALWLTHTKALAKQAEDRMVSMLNNISSEDIGHIGGGKCNTDSDIVIGMVQTLFRQSFKAGGEFGLVILDECHHLPARTFLEVVGKFPSYYMYGLTATPYRRDGLEKVMFASIGNPLAIIDRKDVNAEKGIITPRLIIRKLISDPWVNNNYNYIIKHIIISNDKRSSLIAKDVINEANNNNYCIVISTRKNYCEILYNKIHKEVNCGIATGNYSFKHNQSQIESIERGDINILITTFSLLGEGFDVRRLNRCFIALPFKGKAMVEQAIGRIQRTCEGKDDAIIYDYADMDIGILKNQFFRRLDIYESLGITSIERKTDKI